jgi:hypothetical protein
MQHSACPPFDSNLTGVEECPAFEFADATITLAVPRWYVQ